MLTFRISLPSCTLTKPGYAFVGWATVENGALSYKDGGKLDTPAKDTQMTLYAIWVKSGCYGLAFDPGVEGASWSMVYQHVATNAVDKINACEYSHPDGKSFAGWAKTPTGSVAYKNKVSVKNLTTTDNETVTLMQEDDEPLVSFLYHENELVECVLLTDDFGEKAGTVLRDSGDEGNY